MNGTSHQFVANLALACLDIRERHILYPRWGGIESGTTLSDDFRLMWEPESIENKTKQLVHRYLVDSTDPKDHGGVTRAWDHVGGSISFIEDYVKDPNSYGTEVEFLENLGMYLGIASHHIADLCTPVHVGHKMDYLRAKSKSKAAFHSRVERDISRFAQNVRILFYKPKMVKLTKGFFKRIAVDTYSKVFLRLEDMYANPATDEIQEMVSQVISQSVRHTADVWHSILTITGMPNRKWSMQPLI